MPAMDDVISLDDIVTEDDTPVDNIFSAIQQRMLVEILYSSFYLVTLRPFLANANVGLFERPSSQPLVPDTFLSMDVHLPQDWRQRRVQAYFFWEFGKPPDVVIEIVSNQKGHEIDSKLLDYAHMGVRYYIVFDPDGDLKLGPLLVYELQGGTYVLRADSWLPRVELGVTLWQGRYEGEMATWLRWVDREGNLLLTGAERTEQERQRVEQERQRAERLAAQLRALGLDVE